MDTMENSLNQLSNRMEDVEITNKNDDLITNREDKKDINMDEDEEPAHKNSTLFTGFTRSNGNSINPPSHKSKGIFISTKSTSTSITTILGEEEVVYCDNDKELDPNQPRKFLVLVKQSAQMTNTLEHMEGTAEYIPDNGSSLPVTTKTILQPNAKKIYISIEEVSKLQSIASELCTLMVKAIHKDETLTEIADGFNTEGDGPVNNMQPYLMFNNLFRKFGIGDTTSKVESIDEIAAIKQDDMPDLAYFSKFNIIYKRQKQLNQPLQFDVLLHYMLRNSSYQDTYEFIQTFIQSAPEKTPKKFMELVLERDSKAITNVDRKRRNTTDIEGDHVYGIRSDNYLQVGQIFKPGGCTNCLSSNHIVSSCIRICNPCFQRDPSNKTHAARDCPNIRSSKVSKPQVKTIKSTGKQSSDSKQPLFGSEEHE
jgi:hypothetical protein